MSKRMTRSEIVAVMAEEFKLNNNSEENKKEFNFMLYLTYKSNYQLLTFIELGMRVQQPYKTVLPDFSKLSKVRYIFESNKDNPDAVYKWFKLNGKDKSRAESAEILDEQEHSGDRRNAAISSEILQQTVDDMVERKKDRITEIAKEVSQQFRRVELVVKNKKSEKVLKDVVVPEYFEHMLRLVESRINIMLVGPTGCGKTHVVGLLAEALSMEYSSISCSVGMTESKLEGWLLPTGKNGSFEYVPSQFVTMYENGGIFLLDEIDASDANTLVFINQAIAQDHFYLPKRHNNPLVKKHKDFVIVAAANTYGNGADMMFVGRNQLDAATLDRFRAGMITVDYDARVEEQLIDPEVYKWGLRIRNLLSEHRIKRAMSTRVMIEFTKLKQHHGYGREQWEKSYFADWSEEEKGRIVR